MASAYTLLFSTIVSRHGIRSTFPPLGEHNCNVYSKYSDYDFPTFEDWGMTEEDFCRQYLTPHGEKVVPRMGEYYASLYNSQEGFDYDCGRIAVYADNSTRDHQTAQQLLVGMGCAGHEIITAGKNYLRTEVWPVVHDHYNELNCPLPTEEQITGLYGGDLAALTNAYRDGIQKLTDVIGMTDNFNASICAEVNPDFDSNGDVPCTLLETGYKWTGVYWQGNFLSPISYAGYFAEYFMFQYTSNLTDFAFGSLTEQELSDLYAIHVQMRFYGSSIWNARAYSSQQLGYILASMESVLNDDKAEGVNQQLSNNVLLLVSHDFNNFYLQRLLGIDYFALNFPENVATTAGALHFNLHKDANDAYFVTLKYTAATPQQQRNNVDLTQESPAVANIIIPGCGNLYCPYETFKDIVSRAIDLNCIEEPLRDTLSSLLGETQNAEKENNDEQRFKIWAITATVLLVVVVVILIIVICKLEKGMAGKPSKYNDIEAIEGGETETKKRSANAME